MSSGDLHIDQLNLRVGGLSREQGHRLGEAVARRLAEMTIGGQPRQVDSLFVEVRSDSASIEQLAEKIVHGIRHSLK